MGFRKSFPFFPPPFQVLGKGREKILVDYSLSSTLSSSLLLRLVFTQNLVHKLHVSARTIDGCFKRIQCFDGFSQPFRGQRPAALLVFLNQSHPKRLYVPKPLKHGPVFKVWKVYLSPGFTPNGHLI